MTAQQNTVNICYEIASQLSDPPYKLQLIIKLINAKKFAMAKIEYEADNVCFKKTGTKRSSNTLLCLGSLVKFKLALATKLAGPFALHETLRLFIFRK